MTATTACNTDIGEKPINLAIVPTLPYVAAMISATQIRAARALLGWTQGHLAKTASLSLAVVNNVERNVTDPRRSTLEAIQRALENSGIEFLGDRQNSPDGGPGVRLRRA
jgi:transcriptional regulator with XRE-family HTH domain